MAKKWTKAEREAASIAGKKRWAARKLRDKNTFPLAQVKKEGAHLPYMSADGKPTPQAVLAVDIVRLIAHDVPANVVVDVVERILRP